MVHRDIEALKLLCAESVFLEPPWKLVAKSRLDTSRRINTEGEGSSQAIPFWTRVADVHDESRHQVEYVVVASLTENTFNDFAYLAG